MLKFKLNKERSRGWYETYECELENARITIMVWDAISVFVKRSVYDVPSDYQWYIEIGDHRCKTFSQAKHLAEKMYDIVLWYKPIELWKE